MSRLLPVLVTGDDIHEWLGMPTIPRRGDILWLESLTLGRSRVLEAQVVKVEWARNQVDWASDREFEGIHAWITVRRTPKAVAHERELKARERGAK